MSDMDHRGTLDAFWKARGSTSAEEYTSVLLAAYQLGDKREFGAVLCEISTEEVAFDVVTAFVHRCSAAQ